MNCNKKFKDEDLPILAKEKWQKKGTFRIGEKVKIKGVWFRVKKVNPFGIMLKRKMSLVSMVKYD